MNIGFLCSEYPSISPSHGGIGSATQTLANELVRRGHHATVYAKGETDLSFIDDGVRVVTIGRGRSLIGTILGMRRRIRQDLQRGEIDVIEAPECEAHCLPGGHGTMVRMNGSHHFWCRTLPQKRNIRRLFLEQIGIRQAHGLCAVSRYAAETTRSAMRLGNRPIKIICNPVDTKLFHPTPQAVVRGRVVFVGSVVEKKGIRELCRSMEQVLKACPYADLRIAGRDCPAPDGSTSFRERIEQELTLETRRRTRFLGPLPLAEISRLMATAEVCVFPSYMETQGIVICEAMACGRPVIVTNRGPGPEILGENGECGWLVDPRDPVDISEKVIAALEDSKRGDYMGEAGRERAERIFSVSVCLEKNLSFYRHCSKGS